MAARLAASCLQGGNVQAGMIRPSGRAGRAGVRVGRVEMGWRLPLPERTSCTSPSTVAEPEPRGAEAMAAAEMIGISGGLSDMKRSLFTGREALHTGNSPSRPG
jgi:hypothetical protein